MRPRVLIALIVASGLACLCTVGVAQAAAAAPSAPVVWSTVPEGTVHSPEPAPLLFGTSDPGTTVEFFSDAVCTQAIGSGSAAAFTATGIRITAQLGIMGIYGRATTADGGQSPCSFSFTWWYDDRPPQPLSAVVDPVGMTTRGPVGLGPSQVLLWISPIEAQQRIEVYVNDPTCTAPPAAKGGSVGGAGPFGLIVDLARDAPVTKFYVLGFFHESQRPSCPLEPQATYVHPTPAPTSAPTPTIVPEALPMPSAGPASRPASVTPATPAAPAPLLVRLETRDGCPKPAGSVTLSYRVTTAVRLSATLHRRGGPARASCPERVPADLLAPQAAGVRPGVAADRRVRRWPDIVGRPMKQTQRTSLRLPMRLDPGRYWIVVTAKAVDGRAQTAVQPIWIRRPNAG